VLGGVTHRRPARRSPTVRRQKPSPIKGCGTPVATMLPQTVSRLQPCVATEWEILLRPRVGEGRNNVLRRGRCTNPLCEAVQDWSSSSVVTLGSRVTDSITAAKNGERRVVLYENVVRVKDATSMGEERTTGASPPCREPRKA